jgi:2-polyprenyl-3-methyl-5-hydroxy-6-metoxy-1,4-benzoquinol methylase
VKDVPSDYYDRLRSVEQMYWWHVGMRRTTEAMLRDRLRRGHVRLLGAGCGTGGFLAWASQTGAFDLVTLNDVVQHVGEDLVQAGLREVRRVVGEGGALLSAWAGARGRSPQAPTMATSGIHRGAAGSFTNAVGGAVLALGARYLRGPRRRLPYGHTLFALAVPSAGS